MRIVALAHATQAKSCLAFVTPANDFVAVADALAASPMQGGRLSTEIEPSNHAWLSRATLKQLGELHGSLSRTGVQPLNKATWRYLPPVLKPAKIIATGRNYMDHVREGQEIWAKRGKTVSIPQFPTAFAKYSSSLTAHDAQIQLPEGMNDIDYEVELAVVIGEEAINVPEDRALEYVAGYTICNDIGARGIQRMEMEQQIGIVLAKNFPTFAPMGPWLVTADEIPDPQRLDIRLTVDGDLRQDANTSDMIFSVARLVSYWSKMGLYPGDIIITGTPSGVALAREKPEDFYLRPGQSVSAEIDRIGTLQNAIVAK